MHMKINSDWLSPLFTEARPWRVAVACVARGRYATAVRIAHRYGDGLSDRDARAMRLFLRILFEPHPERRFALAYRAVKGDVGWYRLVGWYINRRGETHYYGGRITHTRQVTGVTGFRYASIFEGPLPDTAHEYRYRERQYDDDRLRKIRPGNPAQARLYPYCLAWKYENV